MNGQELSEALKQIGWNPTELARRLGIRVHSIFDWLNGRRPVPDNVADWLIKVRDLVDQAPPLPDGWRSSDGE